MSDYSKFLELDAEKGHLFWKERGDKRIDAMYAGKRALNANNGNGYKVGRFNGKKAYAHRVIWEMVHGYPPNEIDHINGDRTDNRISNLRNVTSVENKQNMCRPGHNTSGVVGVSYDKRDDAYLAYIHKNNRKVHLGFFKDKEDAIRARKMAEVEYGYHKNHGR